MADEIVRLRARVAEFESAPDTCADDDQPVFVQQCGRFQRVGTEDDGYHDSPAKTKEKPCTQESK